jgi:hypothetical protein
LGGLIAAIAGRQATANTPAAPPTHSAARRPPMIPDFVIRTDSFLELFLARILRLWPVAALHHRLLTSAIRSNTCAAA